MAMITAIPIAHEQEPDGDFYFLEDYPVVKYKLFCLLYQGPLAMEGQIKMHILEGMHGGADIMLPDYNTRCQPIYISDF